MWKLGLPFAGDSDEHRPSQNYSGSYPGLDLRKSHADGQNFVEACVYPSTVPRDLHPRQSWKLQGSICLAGERPPTKHQGVRRPSPDVLRPRRYRVSEIHCVGVDWNVLDHGREPDEILGVRSTLNFFK